MLKTVIGAIVFGLFVIWIGFCFWPIGTMINAIDKNDFTRKATSDFAAVLTLLCVVAQVAWLLLLGGLAFGYWHA